MARSRIPKPPAIDTKVDILKGLQETQQSASPGLRRRKLGGNGLVPLREIYAVQKAVPVRADQVRRSGISSTATSSARKLSKHVNIETTPDKTDHDHDVEKGDAWLDGWPLTQRRLFERDDDDNRLTFAEWKARGYLTEGQRAARRPYPPRDSNVHEEKDAAPAGTVPPPTTQNHPTNDQPPPRPTWRDVPIPQASQVSLASIDDNCPYPQIYDPKDPARRLSKTSLYIQRFLAALTVLIINTIPLVIYFESKHHLWVLVFIVFVKAKDVISTLISFVVFTYRAITCRRRGKDTAPKTILSLITISFETEEQIMKTVDSIREADLGQHRQILCFILDGGVKPNIERRLVRTRKTIRRPYVTWLFNRNEVIIDCGFLDGLPTIYIQKVYNEGKKDSLILCHDLFNVQRADAPLYSSLLRQEIWNDMLPSLIAVPAIDRIDAIFCTDADSTIHPTCQKRLIEELHRNDDTIAACGVLFAELDYRTEWTIWSLFQQFQYSYGQVIRRQAEGIWGRVTCLPGCVTMVKVRAEMGPTISDYAKPIQDATFWRHQVQYLGTDRRLTFSMISQGKSLKTIVVPDAVSETVCPQSLKHYLNQRRRWGSNAYFNNYFYCFGRNQFLITRLWAFIDITRMTLVYYRQANNILFLWHLARNFTVIKIVPLLVVTQTPTVWFLVLVVARHPILRRRLHKLVLGLLLNYILSPILSIVVFTRMIVQLGSSGITWNNTGACTAKPDPTLRITTPRNSLSSTYRLQRCIRPVLLGECLTPDAEKDHSSLLDETRPARPVQDAQLPADVDTATDAAARSTRALSTRAPSTRAPSVADTMRTARSELPRNVLSSFHSARRRSSSRRSSSREEEARWPLGDGEAPPLPGVPVVDGVDGQGQDGRDTQVLDRQFEESRQDIQSGVQRRLRRPRKSLGEEEEV